MRGIIPIVRINVVRDVILLCGILITGENLIRGVLITRSIIRARETLLRSRTSFRCGVIHALGGVRPFPGIRSCAATRGSIRIAKGIRARGVLSLFPHWAARVGRMGSAPPDASPR